MYNAELEPYEWTGGSKLEVVLNLTSKTVLR